jgi:hypothetical protein
MNADPKIGAYLSKVRASLGSATASDEEEVVREVDARIQELAAEPGATAESALERIGPADKVAHRYRDSLLIAKASQSYSPVLLLRGSLKNGVAGVLAFIVGLAGYWIGGCILVFGTLALMWSAAHYTPNAPAAIGSNMLQTIATVVAGAVLLAITSFLLRALLRASKRMRSSI